MTASLRLQFLDVVLQLAGQALDEFEREPTTETLDAAIGYQRTLVRLAQELRGDLPGDKAVRLASRARGNLLRLQGIRVRWPAWMPTRTPP